MPSKKNNLISKYQENYYDKGEYNSIHPYIKRKIEIIQLHIKGFKDLLVLDIGCYTGEVTAEFKKLGAKAIGLDISFISLRKAKSKNLDVIRSDISEALPFKDNTFNFMYCSEVIEHLMDTDKFIIEMNRILKKDGLLFLTTPNIAALKNRIRLLFGKYPYNLEYKLGGAGHIHLYNREKLKEQLESNGFEVIKFYGINIFPWKLCQKSNFIYYLNSLLSNNLSSLSLNMAVMAKKKVA